MSRRLKPTLADYVVIAINPVLIMGLVGSLVYFLLEMLYGGAYPDRLQFCLTMFVFAIVLISRIAMEDGFEHAAPFGIAIAVLVGIAMNRFVVYQSTAAASFGWIINWGLMALTWWCAHKLTWDCTTIDESEDASGRGLLETAGIEKTTDEPAQDPPAPVAPANLPPATELSQKRWQQFLDRKHRPHTPGVWIVYFSLASLPIFGLGQLFIPAERVASRRYVFLLLCVYVGCGLSLLLTTSFLSLRRYLRQRRLEMPAAMAGNWLAIGAVMVVGLLLFSALLPRPSPEYAISALPSITGSAEHGASPVSAGSEGRTTQRPAAIRASTIRPANHRTSRPISSISRTSRAAPTPGTCRKAQAGKLLASRALHRRPRAQTARRENRASSPTKNHRPRPATASLARKARPISQPATNHRRIRRPASPTTGRARNPRRRPNRRIHSRKARPRPAIRTLSPRPRRPTNRRASRRSPRLLPNHPRATRRSHNHSRPPRRPHHRCRAPGQYSARWRDCSKWRSTRC